MIGCTTLMAARLPITRWVAAYTTDMPPRPSSCSMRYPPARAIVVIGSGGRAHWDAFLDYVGQDPVPRLSRTSHPLDDFCRSVMPPLDGCRVIFPSRMQFDFMKLAELAGLGAPSELGTL